MNNKIEGIIKNAGVCQGDYLLIAHEFITLDQRLADAEKDAELARSVYKDLTVHDLDAVKTLDGYKKCIGRLMREKEEMRGILLELGPMTHRNKRLYDWYCENSLSDTISEKE